MRAPLVIVLALLAVSGQAASGQEASARETRCSVGNVAFSSGMGISAGEGVVLCDAGNWSIGKVDTPVAGCLLEGKLSSVGAVVGVRNSDSMLLQCDVSGRWITIETAAKE